MSKRCSYYHCQAPQACECYGWCAGHRAGLATWLCRHLKGEPVVEPIVEPVIEQVIEQVSITTALVEPEEEPTEDELSQIKHYLDRELGAVLNTVNEDATPPVTPHELIEQLALEHQATMEKVSREMQEMKAKLEYYESQAIIKEQIASKEKEITQLEKKAVSGRHRTLSVPRVTPRVAGLKPVEKISKK